eukprot:1074100-Pyramimonas_sp.AAC.1
MFKRWGRKLPHLEPHLREWSCWRYRVRTVLKTPNTGRKPGLRLMVKGSALCSEENSGPGIRLRNYFVERGGGNKGWLD